jgi:3'-phosphoadenosine 5'-phosphosulfate sulfotransferase (PAPS reductase)/FAD synthetase
MDKRVEAGTVATDLQDLLNDLERGDYYYLRDKVDSMLGFVCCTWNVEPAPEEPSQSWKGECND